MQSPTNRYGAHFAAVMESVARELVTVDSRADGAFITTPLLYPSGANVLVRVEAVSATEYFVSDYGLGFSESDMIGATSQFRRHAPQIAENAGIKFDSQAFFVARVSRDQLTGACAAVGNCSLEAVSFAALRLSDKRFADAADDLHRRLVSIFTEQHVLKDVPFTGASQTQWHVSNVVRLGTPGGPDEHTTIFEPVTKHHASIAAAVTKFHDIARLDNPPRRVIVVRKKDDFGTYLGVLSQAADVVGRDVPDSTIRKLAA